MHVEWKYPYARVVTTDADLVRIERAIGELWRVSSSRRVHEARMATLGLDLSRTEQRFLRRLNEQGALAVSALADELDVSQPTASRSLRRLEQAGLVTRGGDATDGRVARYQLTAKGRRVWRRLHGYMHDQLAAALADLPPRRCHDLALLLEELTTRLRLTPEETTRAG